MIMRNKLVVHEGILHQTLNHIFPNTQIHSNVMKNTNAKYPATNSYMEFDIWIPEHSLCFEFQDAYHYTLTWYFQNTQEHIQHKDYVKKNMALQKKMSLIVIPYWWDTSAEMLIDIIKFQRPDLNIPVISNPQLISLNPPLDSSSEGGIPDVGELMAPSFPPYHFDKINHDDWWLGEKYDGVRCCWNSDRKKVYARTGKEIQLPANFTEHLPSIYLDSEIWFGRGGFLDSVGIIKGTTLFQWPALRLLAFDIPLSNLREPYEERYGVLLQNVAQNHAFLIISGRAMHHKDNLYWFVQYVIDGGGEGVILQQRGSVYECGRSLSLIKLKTATGDQEAIVIGIGDHKAVTLKLPTGLTFTVPPESVHIPTPAPGDIVSFSYEANSRYDLPTNPQIYRIRGDVSWDDVVHSFFKEKQFLNEASIHGKGSTALPKSYWNRRTIREHMVRFAKSRNLDPFAPETWQNSAKAFRQSVSGKKILKKFKNKYYSLVRKIFPELSLWLKSTDKKKLLEKYAKARDFDALKAENWYLHLKTANMSEKGTRNFAKALLDLFPNIGLERSKLRVMQSADDKQETRCKFFERYAKFNAFDPQIPANWYAQTRDKIMSMKGAQEVMAHYGNSLSKALLDVFPNIGLDVTKFHVHRLAMWHKVENRKKFFEMFAQQNGFDHKQAENWYSQPREKIMAVKGARSVIAYHGQSLSRTLMDLFPDIGFDKTKFRAQKCTFAREKGMFSKKA